MSFNCPASMRYPFLHAFGERRISKKLPSKPIPVRGNISCVHFSPDGSIVAVGNCNGRIIIMHRQSQVLPPQSHLHKSFAPAPCIATPSVNKPPASILTSPADQVNVSVPQQSRTLLLLRPLSRRRLHLRRIFAAYGHPDRPRRSSPSTDISNQSSAGGSDYESSCESERNSDREAGPQSDSFLQPASHPGAI